MGTGYATCDASDTVVLSDCLPGRDLIHMCSRILVRGGLALAVVLVLASGSSAQTTPIVRLACSPDDFPGCGGWGVRNNNSYVSLRLVRSAGPGGQDVAQFDLIPGGSHAQYYMGWGRSVPAASQGATRYARVKMRILAPLNLASHQPEGAWASKFVILGDGGLESSRVIVELKTQTGNELSTRVQRNIDGDPNRTGLIGMSNDAWHSLQWEIRSSSSSGASDARLKMWQDGANSNYGSPTSQSGNFFLSTAAWSNLNLGYYASGVLVPNVGRVSIQVAAFEYDDEFDPNWHSAGSGGGSGGGGGSANPPAAPANLRLLSSVFGLVPFGALTAFAVRRRRQ